MKTPFVNIHTHSANNIDNKDFIEIRNIDVDNIVNTDVSFLFSVGIHPWTLSDKDEKICQDILKCIEANIGRRDFLAIGECGLDRVHKDTLELQRKIFIKHIEMSEKYHKPLIIHSVRSYPDIISIRKETKATQKWILHGFQGNEQIVRQLLSHDFYFSLGDVLFKDEKKASTLLDVIHRDKLFLETDDSEIDIVDVYKKVSAITSTGIDELKNIVFNNFVKIFGEI